MSQHVLNTSFRSTADCHATIWTCGLSLSRSSVSRPLRCSQLLALGYDVAVDLYELLSEHLFSILGVQT